VAFLLHPPEAEEELRKTWRLLPSDTEMRSFDHRSEALAPLVGNIRNSVKMLSEPQSISVVAPYYFIRQAGIQPDQTGKYRLFANNFTVQGVKIKTCKSVLNRVYCHLAGLKPEELQSCPFLQKKEDTYTVDLSFIPEKYRLDVKLGEEILVRCLRKWLSVLETTEDLVSHNP
jgi:ATP-dependent Lon protease